MSMEFKKHAKQPKKRTTLIEGENISNFLLEKIKGLKRQDKKNQMDIESWEDFANFTESDFPQDMKTKDFEEIAGYLEEFGVYLKLSEKQEKFIKTCEESEIAFVKDFIRKYTGYTRNTEIMDKALKESKKYPEFEKILRKLLSA